MKHSINYLPKLISRFREQSIDYRKYRFVSSVPSVDGRGLYWPQISSKYYDRDSGPKFRVEFKTEKIMLDFGRHLIVIKCGNIDTFVALLDAMAYKDECTDLMVSSDFSPDILRKISGEIIRNDSTGDSVVFEDFIGRAQHESAEMALINSIAEEFIFFAYTENTPDCWYMYGNIEK